MASEPTLAELMAKLVSMDAQHTQHLQEMQKQIQHVQETQVTQTPAKRRREPPNLAGRTVLFVYDNVIRKGTFVSEERSWVVIDHEGFKVYDQKGNEEQCVSIRMGQIVYDDDMVKKLTNFVHVDQEPTTSSPNVLAAVSTTPSK